jgi:hypothetical protein
MTSILVHDMTNAMTSVESYKLWKLSPVSTHVLARASRDYVGLVSFDSLLIPFLSSTMY